MYTYILVALLVFTGLYFSIRTRFVQIRYLKEMVVQLFEKKVDKGGRAISSFPVSYTHLNDPAFKDYEKPIGAFMTEAEAKAFAKATGCQVHEDSGRGWRRVVPSPCLLYTSRCV